MQQHSGHAGQDAQDNTEKDLSTARILVYQ